MTTLAIIGGGIAGRSLLYALAKEKNHYSQVFLFESEDFASPCSLNSTAVVAPRGVSLGHSSLGDLIAQGFLDFQKHVDQDSPQGVTSISQFTGSTTKLDEFKKRYPAGSVTKHVLNFALKEDIYFAHENAFLIDPPAYLSWLLNQAKTKLSLKYENDFVKELEKGSSHFVLKTQKGQTIEVDQVVLATGHANRLWGPMLPALKEVNAKAVQGCYFEIAHDLGNESFSLTLDGHNLFYHAQHKRALVGSTSEESFLLVPPRNKLNSLLIELSEKLSLHLPSGTIRVGLREKAKQRKPYLVQKDNLFAVGGFYKNGFTLGPSFGKKAAALLVRK